MTQAVRKPGRLARALIRLIMKPARVVSNEPVVAGFRLITLESDAFKGLRWVPGQKVQIAMGSAFAARTFTPIEWDAAAGRTRLLGYAHGHGPGSAWIDGAKPGDDCDVFGPRASLDVGDAAEPRVVFGDETSIGLAHALARHVAGGPQYCLLEANDVGATRAVLARLELGNTDVFARAPDEAHLDDIAQRLPALADGNATFVLTGKAASIQRMLRTLRALGVRGSRLMTKAYWAPGKTGLD